MISPFRKLMCLKFSVLICVLVLTHPLVSIEVPRNASEEVALTAREGLDGNVVLGNDQVSGNAEVG